MRERLLWLDVGRGLLHETDPAADDSTYELGPGVGALAPCDAERVALGTAAGFALVDLPVRRTARAGSAAGAADEILNDGACNPRGTAVGGQLRGGRAAGRRTPLHGPRRDGARRARAGDALDGLGWSPDGRTMYYVDTPTQGLDAFGGLRRRDQRDLGAPPRRDGAAEVGLPDGIAVDDAGAV